MNSYFLIKFCIVKAKACLSNVRFFCRATNDSFLQDWTFYYILEIIPRVPCSGAKSKTSRNLRYHKNTKLPWYVWLVENTQISCISWCVPISDIEDTTTQLLSRDITATPSSSKRLLPTLISSRQSWLVDCTRPSSFYCSGCQSSVGDLLFFFLLSFLIRLL